MPNASLSHPTLPSEPAHNLQPRTRPRPRPSSPSPSSTTTNINIATANTTTTTTTNSAPPASSPHLPLVISSFTRPARPPPSIDPKRLTINFDAGEPQILGRGTFGIVYPGYLDSVCPIAVKHLRPSTFNASSTPVSRQSARDAASRYARLARKQFRREIRRYCALRTVPGVVRFYGLAGHDKFVIERLFGGALSTALRHVTTTTNADGTNLLNPRCILRLASMLTNAVADLHRRGMSHGDLKPANVLLSEPLHSVGGIVTDAVHVKLVDFGLSRRFHPLDGDDDEYDTGTADGDGDCDGVGDGKTGNNHSDDGFDTDDLERMSITNSTSGDGGGGRDRDRNRDRDIDKQQQQQQNSSRNSSGNHITLSVQLAARRYSCPITRPAENSDTDLSDDEQLDDDVDDDHEFTSSSTLATKSINSHKSASVALTGTGTGKHGVRLLSHPVPISARQGHGNGNNRHSMVDDEHDGDEDEDMEDNERKDFQRVSTATSDDTERYMDHEDDEDEDEDEESNKNSNDDDDNDDEEEEEDDDDEDDEDDDDNVINPDLLTPFPKDARGTPAFLSPEGWCGPAALTRRHVAFKSDVYALGMILFELESGKTPWHGYSEWSIFVAVSNNAQRPAWASEQERVPGLRSLIERCWAQNYHARPTCRQVASDLHKLLQRYDADANADVDVDDDDVQQVGAVADSGQAGGAGVIHKHALNEGIESALSTTITKNNRNSTAGNAVESNTSRPTNHDHIVDNDNDKNNSNINNSSSSGSVTRKRNGNVSQQHQHQHQHQHPFINKVEYTTPPASTTSLVSASQQPPSRSHSPPRSSPTAPSQSQLHDHHPSSGSGSTAATAANDHPPPLASLTPPSSPARTSSHPSPLRVSHTTTTSSSNHNSNTITSSTSSFQAHVASFSISSTTPSLDLHQQHQSSMKNPSTSPTKLLENQHQHQHQHQTSPPPPPPPPPQPSRNSNPTAMTPSARQQRSDALRPKHPRRVSGGIPINTRSANPSSNLPTSSSSTPANASTVSPPQQQQAPPPHKRKSSSSNATTTVRSIEYPYKDLLVRDDCAGLCTLVVRHERNQKEVTAVLEALGALLENSPDNCILVAKGDTLPTLATILSRYGPKDHRLCKSACVIIQRLALSQNIDVEMRLRVSSAVDMVLNCMRWHAADLPVMQIGAYTLDALCRLSHALCSIFVSQGGPNAALRALSRAAKSFNRDVLVASVALQVLGVTAREHGHALLEDDLLAEMFKHCHMFQHERIDERFVSVVHTLLRGMSEARDKMVSVPNCFVVFSDLVDRTRGSSSWVPLFRYTSEIVSDLCRGGMRQDTTNAVLNSHIVEATVESLNKLCQRDINGAGGLGPNQTRSTIASSSHSTHDDAHSSSNIADSSADVSHGAMSKTDVAIELAEVSAAVAGLMALLQLCDLGADVLGSFQMCNCFEMTRRLVKRAPNNHAIAYHVAVLLIAVLVKKNGPALVADRDLVYDMLVEMKEKWRHDTIVVENVSQAMQLIQPVHNDQVTQHHNGHHQHHLGNNKLRKKHDQQQAALQMQQQQMQQQQQQQMKHAGGQQPNNLQASGRAEDKLQKAGKPVKEKGGWLWRRKARGN